MERENIRGIMKGYLPLNRKFFDHFLWKEKREYSKAEAWIDMIEQARYIEEGHAERIINSKLITWTYGQFPASVRYLKKRWNWRSTCKVKNFLDLLKSNDMIDTHTEQGETIITLCNYGDYDPKKNSEKTPNRTATEQQQNRNRTGKEQQQNKEEEGKESKEGKEGKEYKSSCPGFGVAESPDVNRADRVADGESAGYDGEPSPLPEKKENTKPWAEFEKSKMVDLSADQFSYDGEPWEAWARTAVAMHKHVLDYKPDHQTVLKAKFDNWFHPVRLMVEQDGRDLPRIQKLWRWARKDDFEQVNVLSPDKLRTRFDDLEIKMNKQEQQPNRKTNGRSDLSSPSERIDRQKEAIRDYYGGINGLQKTGN